MYSRLNPWELLAIQHQVHWFLSGLCPATDKDTLGLALLRVWVSGELKVVLGSKPLTCVQHQLHGISGRSKKQQVITEQKFECLVCFPASYLKNILHF